jgi:hypothetical protein
MVLIGLLNPKMEKGMLKLSGRGMTISASTFKGKKLMQRLL